MKNLRIEEIGDINYDYPYLEVFLNDKTEPFMEVSINEKKELIFKYFASNFDVLLNVEEWNYILVAAREFLPKALRNEDDFLKLL